ncbi:AAA family ATPase [Desulfonatronum thioautotrophicum]|uniref:AAA family ATPase n=1 Tax=Desulfonatronum thioautotrophicum TaxID=617001 RepID=UPI0005EBDD52|nr:AAA family ATPase [Desulfonatronum thioautotrophicum]
MPTNHDIALGESNFLLLRANPRNYFVDKSHFITRVFQDSSPVQLFPRPRRFGKTLNLTMLKAFSEHEPASGSGDWPHREAFAGLSVLQDTEIVDRHAGRYPIIFLTFKDVKTATWEQTLFGFSEIIATEMERLLPHLPLADLPDYHRKYIDTILQRRASASDLQFFLQRITALLAQHSSRNAIVLIDEYDTPILSAWTHGYYEEAITFFRNFLGAGLKDNPHLAKGVLTGILRIAKESVFSGLNNLEVYSLLRQQHADSFGFTPSEVGQMLGSFGLPERSKDVANWYDGYLFGQETIFNPWSILNFLKAPEEGCRPYWLNTSSNDLVRDLVMARASCANDRLQQELDLVMTGQPLAKVLDDHLVLRNITAGDDSLWQLLTMSGYLQARPAGMTPDGKRPLHLLAIPNIEVSLFYEDTLRAWLNQVSGDAGNMPAMLDALLQGRMEDFILLLENFALGMLSYYDVGGTEPERFYHAMFLGMFLHLNTHYDITSNREAGLGRYDIALIPKMPGQRGIVLELKKAGSREKLEAKAQAALEQAEAREYVAVLDQCQSSPQVLVGIALRGKRVAVRWKEIGGN